MVVKNHRDSIDFSYVDFEILWILYYKSLTVNKENLHKQFSFIKCFKIFLSFNLSTSYGVGQRAGIS